MLPGTLQISHLPSEIFFETGVDLNDPSFRAFIRGYGKHYCLDEELIAHLPVWMRVVNLTMYAKLVRAMDLAHEQNYSEWCSSLLVRLENWIQNYKVTLHKEESW